MNMPYNLKTPISADVWGDVVLGFLCEKQSEKLVYNFANGVHNIVENVSSN
ncbi:MAG: hypothetical protein HQK49_11680 [Oligoflexia bacterium]|nr:hypothetical protein [Oligoflexia bacterium]